MATELQITTYRNILTILNSFKEALTTLNNQCKLILASSYMGGPGIYNTTAATGLLQTGGITIPNFTQELNTVIGFAVSVVGKKGNKGEWRYLVQNNVLNNVPYYEFLYEAYSKSTGDKGGTGTILVVWPWNSKLRGIRNAKKYDPNKFHNWLTGQIARQNYIQNDVLRYGEALELELNRVRIPMPPKFITWLREIRDTSIAASSSYDWSQRLINTYNLFALTLQKGELVVDLNTIKTLVDKEIAEIEKAASAPPVKLTTQVQPNAPLPPQTPTLIPVKVAEPVKVVEPAQTTSPVTTQVIPQTQLAPVSLDNEKTQAETVTKKSAAVPLTIAALLSLLTMV